jgi:serine/alanine adding enzyme
MQQTEQRLEVSQLEKNDHANWDAYVTSHPEASLYHDTRWLPVMRHVFDHECYYLLAKRAGAVAGVLPLVRLQSPLFGDYMVSVPALNYGGVLANSDATAASLLCEAAELATSLGCSHIETRDLKPLPVPWTQHTNRITMIRELPESAAQLDKEIGTKLRAQVKRPRREGATTKLGGTDLVQDFYKVFAQNMRDLGTPVYPQAFFEEILSANPDNAWVVVVYVADKPAAAGFLLRHRDRMEIPWASSLRIYNRISVNMLLYWECLSLSIELGCTEFDFGRTSEGAATYRFKQQWKSKPTPLIWHYYATPGSELPDLSPRNEAFSLVVKAWQQMPLQLANRLGPFIVRGLP